MFGKRWKRRFSCTDQRRERQGRHHVPGGNPSGLGLDPLFAVGQQTCLYEDDNNDDDDD